jgi:fengycin family lipopeptide synthetase D/gramicidin S synthase 2/tyrocidine synthetase-2
MQLSTNHSPQYPITPSPHHPIYLTGDLARWISNGNIEFLGRIDHQVKIRGCRIEPGEIENQLLDIEGIKQAIVIDRLDESGQKYLCAYFVSKQSIDPPDLGNQLLKRLPDYMVPAYFIQLEKIPLTSTGKIDRHALPGPEAGTARQIYTPPANEMEEKLIEIWQEVLGAQKIGTTDNFFQLGGDSIKAIQVSARLKKYQLELNINDLFLYPTIKELVEYVTPIRQISAQEHNQGTVTGQVPLTPIQQWFFENDFTSPHHYNNAVMLYKKQGFDQTFIKKLFTQLLIHHDALRMVYRKEADQILQWNRGTDEKKQGNLFDMEVFPKTHTDPIAIEKEANRIQAGIDLTRGPLVKLALFKTPKGDHLLIVIHHLVIDGISWRILFEDISIGYRQLQQGEEIKFQEKTVSFKDWTRQLKQYSESKEILKELEYWQTIEKTKSPALPVDYLTGEKKKKYKEMKSQRIELDEKQTGQLLKEVHLPYKTNIDDILLTALAMAIKEWSGNETMVINLEGHGRETISENMNIDISRTVGWFTAQYPVLLEISSAAHLSTTIKLIKETLRRIPHKGIGWGLLRYLTPGNKKKGIPLNVNPEISFNYLGQFHENNDSGVFAFSPLPTGESVSTELETLYKIDISGLVKGNILTFSINYGTCQYKKETIERLAHSFKTNLEKIICHCTGKDEKELTPSDLGDKELSLEELEDIKEMISL